ncbi:MAG TPA: hypothetical protein VGK32_07840 [Vicinamibacterales bacterium]|jgi:chromosome segregation ATPase
MRISTLAWVLLAALGVTEVARAQTLADVARKEEERRKALKTSGKVYTNDDLKRYPVSTAPASEGDKAAAGAGNTTVKPEGAVDAKAGAAAQAKEQAATEEKGEAYWRNLLSQTRTQLERSQSFLEALQSRVNGLTADFYARDDPAQRTQLWNQRTKALEEMERLKKDIADSTRQLNKIQDDARRAGVPPGWLR